MSAPLPQSFTWDAERSVMVPVRRLTADKTYVDGELYRLGVVEERSLNSHNHFFAALHEAWLNLPELMAERFPTEEHLRRTALIEKGWHNSHTLACASNAQAVRVAAFMKPIDEFAVVIVRGSTVTRYTAKSQSARAMGREEFQKSKQDVLDYVADLIGKTPKELAANAGKAA